MDSIEDVEHLNIFLTTINEEDCTKTMFIQNYSNNKSKSITKQLKVNTICQAIRNYILTLNPTKLKVLFPALISTYVMETPKRVAEALKTIQLHSSLGKLNLKNNKMFRKWSRGKLFFKMCTTSWIFSGRKNFV